MLVWCCAANQYSENNDIFLKKFQIEERVLRVNKSEISCENTFNGDHFETEAKHDSSNDEETLFLVFFKICDLCFNSLTSKYVCLRFWNIVWVFQFLSLFQWILEASSALTVFWTNF